MQSVLFQQLHIHTGDYKIQNSLTALNTEYICIISTINNAQLCTAQNGQETTILYHCHINQTLRKRFAPN